MEDRLLDKIAEPFNINLPEKETMEQTIDAYLPAVKKFSEKDLTDENSPLYKVDWIKMSDKPGMTTISMHTFIRASNEIRIANDGVMDGLVFRVLNSKRVIIGQSMHRDAFLYELAFLDNDFFILKQHGNEANFRKGKYLFFCREGIGDKLTWNQALEKMVDRYRNNEFPWVLIAVIAAIVLGVLVYLR